MAQTIPGVLLCCALAILGEALVAGLGLAVPGAVIGLSLYLAGLYWCGSSLAWARPGAELLLLWLGALIVPALIGVVDFAVQPGFPAVKIALVLLVTTPITAVTTALVFRGLARRVARPESGS